ncbi:MAG: hypothetical protein ACE5GM_08615 [bacterium]
MADQAFFGRRPLILALSPREETAKEGLNALPFLPAEPGQADQVGA